MKFREHRGGLAESMETVVELEDWEDFGAHLAKIMQPWHEGEMNVHIDKYTEDGDPRIGWEELYIVTVDNFGVVGWLDSTLPQNSVQLMDKEG